jgi:serine/threonine-protein kinase
MSPDSPPDRSAEKPANATSEDTLPPAENVSPNAYGELTIARHDETRGESPAAGATSRPERFGKYQVVAEIGRGAFGTVYRGFDPQLDRPVAIKVPRIRPAAGGCAPGATATWNGAVEKQPVVDDFLREARKLAALKHPGIVTLLDVNVHGHE